MSGALRVSRGRDGRDERKTSATNATNCERPERDGRDDATGSAHLLRRRRALWMVNCHGTAGNDRKEQATTGTTGTTGTTARRRVPVRIGTGRACRAITSLGWAPRARGRPFGDFMITVGCRMGSACARAPVCDTSRSEPPPSCRCLSFLSLPAVPIGSAMPLTERAHVTGAAPVAPSRPSRSGLHRFVAPVAPVAFGGWDGLTVRVGAARIADLSRKRGLRP